MILTVKGKAAAVVRDADAYQSFLDIAARADVFESIRQGLDDVDRSRLGKCSKRCAEIMTYRVEFAECATRLSRISCAVRRHRRAGGLNGHCATFFTPRIFTPRIFSAISRTFTASSMSWMRAINPSRSDGAYGDRGDHRTPSILTGEAALGKVRADLFQVRFHGGEDLFRRDGDGSFAGVGSA